LIGVGGLVPAASAGAVTIGQASGAVLACITPGFTTETSQAAADYTIPAAGGVIDRWSTLANSSFQTSGAPVELLLLKPLASNGYEVLAFDDETLPTPLPASGVATFTLATPITAQPGAVLGVRESGGSSACIVEARAGDDGMLGSAGSPPVQGGVYTATGGPFTSAGAAVSVDLAQSMDVGLTGAAHPSTITTGGGSALVFSLSDQATAIGTASFSETVPNGLSVLSAVSGSGSCSVAGQTVACTTGLLDPGSITPIDVTVSASAPGAYATTAMVTSSFADPNAANNAATVALTVTPPPGPACRVVRFTGIALAETKRLLSALNCTVGRVTKHASTRIPKGDVISTNPSAGTYPSGATVAIVESSGKPKRKRA
jgi:hypothetical protein